MGNKGIRRLESVKAAINGFLIKSGMPSKNEKHSCENRKSSTNNFLSGFLMNPGGFSGMPCQECP